ncbi:SLITRK3 [Branchiostoma lanceolatum]|uniref:SLITRK3 protein n=1 Tax=Branchiostoma lanceolatum TaxID=7740 RepID=A0A8J9ZD13_BRALA|nr:SLITRK3 [Branchiostoma lanceolatum]
MLLAGRTAMEKRSRQCVAILVLLVLKFSLPCPEECFVQYEWKSAKKKVCECPRQRDTQSGFQAACASTGITSVTGILLNSLFNLTTLTKHHIPRLRNLITFVITGSTIQAIEAGAFSSLPSMMSVAIRCSRLLHIGDKTFYNLPRLKTIFLNHNFIETVSPRAFIDNKSLYKIYLNDNNLKVVPFDALSLIHRNTTVARLQVNLENNQISTVLEAGWTKISNTGVTLRLRDNPLVCDGGMRWLVCNATTLARGTEGVISESGNLQCTSPSELAGCDFKSLHTSSFCSSTELTTASPTASSSVTQRYQHSGATTEDATDNEETDETEKASARQNPYHKRHGVTINTSELISNRLYKSSGSAINNANKDTETAEETEMTLTLWSLSAFAYVLFSRTGMEKRSRQCVAILVLLVLKFSLPCPEECFVEHPFGPRGNCECPRQRDKSFQISCVSPGLTVAANTACSAENDGYTCLNDVPTGFDQSVTGITLNRLLNLTTLTKQHIPPLPNLIKFEIIGSTIQAIEAGAFSSIPSIMSVIIHCSRLLHIADDTFCSLLSLKTINLKHNLIETVSPRAFVGLNSLYALNVEGNQLKAVPFEALSLIRQSSRVSWIYVILSNNQISTVLETNWKKIIDTRLTIHLKVNPFDCDGRIRWLVCNAMSSALGVIYHAGHLQCSSPSGLTGYDFKSLQTNSFCSSTELTTITMKPTFPMAEPTTAQAKSLKTTNFALTQRWTKTTPGTMDSTRELEWEKNLDGGQQAGMDYVYIPVGLTIAVILLLSGLAIVATIYNQCVLKGRPNPANGHHVGIVRSQLIRNRMYQRSGATTGDARDNEETGETESARQNPVHKRHGVIINTSELISNRLYKSSRSVVNNADTGTATAEETELTPYLTVPFDAINNTLRIEPYSTVNLDDIRDEQPNADLRPPPDRNRPKNDMGLLWTHFK